MSEQELDGLTRAYLMGKTPTDSDLLIWGGSGLRNYVTVNQAMVLKILIGTDEFGKYLKLLKHENRGFTQYIRKLGFRCGKSQKRVISDAINRGIKIARNQAEYTKQMKMAGGFTVPKPYGQSIIDTIHEKMFFGEGVGRPTGIADTVAWTANDVINNINRDNK